MLNYQAKSDSTYLQISTNGLLSFDAAFDEHSIQSFPKSADPLLPLIAPLWADLNFRDSGAIFYRIVSDVSTLSEVATLIAEQNDIYRSFSPTMAVIVTWFQGGVLGTYSVFQNFRLIRRPYLTEVRIWVLLYILYLCELQTLTPWRGMHNMDSTLYTLIIMQGVVYV